MIVRVLSFNIWWGCNHGTMVNDTVKVIVDCGADIIGIQEPLTKESPHVDVMPLLAKGLGFHWDSDSAILSRWPIVQSSWTENRSFLHWEHRSSGGFGGSSLIESPIGRLLVTSKV